MRPLPLLLLLIAAPAGAQPTEPSPATVVAKVQKYYDATHELHARFEQRIESPTRAPTLGSGDVWIKKPGKMRWDYQKPEKKLMVSDGSTLWVYEPEDEQAFKQELRSSTLPSQVSFLIGEGRLSQEFDASKQPGIGGPGEVALKMVPKTGTAAYRYLVFVVDAATGQVKQTIIYGQDGTTNRLSFAAVEQNKGIDDAKFKFAPPAGTRILTPPKPQ
jgi:outer membrane lipoprotein carrier protein